MHDIESLLNRWQSAGILDAETAARIRAQESQAANERSKPREQDSEQQVHAAGLSWQSLTALILGAILLACGVALFISAHWDEFGPTARLTSVLAMVAVFHLAGGFTRERFRSLSTAFHAIGTLAV